MSEDAAHVNGTDALDPMSIGVHPWLWRTEGNEGDLFVAFVIFC